MSARRFRKLLREPIWFLLLGALVIGAILGNTMAHEPISDVGRIAFGRAWSGDAAATRAALAGIFGFLITIFTVIVSLNTILVKGAGYQYSPRLVPLYMKKAPIRRTLPVLVFLSAFVLAAERELGLIPDAGERPRVVVSVASFILFLALILLAVDLFQTLRFVRVERVLGLIRDATFAAAKRFRDRLERLPLGGTAPLPLPPEASALVALASGYVVDVDVGHLVRLAERREVRTRIARAIGEYVAEGDVIGWVATDAGTPVDPRVSREIAATLEISPVRELDYDSELGIQIIVDAATRALSSSANDSYTARQALNQLRSVLRQMGRLPLGDWSVLDKEGRVRVSARATHLRDLLSIAVNGPLPYASKHPDVLEGLLEIVFEAGWIARDPVDRAVARNMLERVEGLAEQSELDPERLERLRAEAIPVRRSLEMAESPEASGRM